MSSIIKEARVYNVPRKVICAFYASTTYGSEYRAGLEFIKFAAANGFDLAIVADLEENSSVLDIESAALGVRVVRVPSPVRRQKNLYRYTDLFPQCIWHLRVAKWIRKNIGSVECLWIQNGASPWLPLSQYYRLPKVIIWGPVGGGEAPSAAMMRTLLWKDRLRERFRSQLEKILLRKKLTAIRLGRAPRAIVIARTNEAQRQLGSGLCRFVPVIPEILEPLEAINSHRTPSENPKLVWVGQNIPRKNLALALQIFRRLRDSAFRGATLDVFGCDAPNGVSMSGVTFHGWVPSVPWQEFRNDGVLLLTSFREGLPSAVLEAARNGLLCITADVGAIGSLDVPTVHLLPKDEYPNYTIGTLRTAERRIRLHLAQTQVQCAAVSNQQKLKNFLQAEGAIE
jgi:glycosyltransferase involved in cell wall biosynthesis